MTLDDLREQMKDVWADAVGRIEGSPTFNTLKEKWEQLAPSVQRLVIGALSAIVVLGILSIPYGFYSSSSANLTKFEEDRTLLRRLLKAGRLKEESSQVTPIMSIDDVKAQLNTSLASFGLIEEQLAGINDIASEALGGNLAGSELDQDGLAVNLKKLTLTQVQEIGFNLQKIGPSVKLAGMEVEAGSPDPHYFNAVFKLAVFRMRPSARQDSSEDEPADEEN